MRELLRKAFSFKPVLECAEGESIPVTSYMNDQGSWVIEATAPDGTGIKYMAKNKTKAISGAVREHNLNFCTPNGCLKDPSKCPRGGS